MVKKISYKDAGVDIDAGNQFAGAIKQLVSSTFRPEVLSEIGGFAGLFSLNTEKYKNPVLVSSTDGVGTKLRIATMLNKHDTIGIDLVAMCVNDIIVQGAEPLFLLDYISTGKIRQDILLDVIKGIIQGCAESGCCLLGGETAEMPSFYEEGEYDLAGFVVGVVNRDSLIDGSNIAVGDKLIGIASSGLHSNGYSLARKIFFDQLQMKVDEYVKDFNKTLGEELITPTRIYAKAIANLLRDFHIHGMAHITGGGLIDNIERILPHGCTVHIKKKSWDIHPVFSYIQEKGGVTENEMFRTFNNGIGMVLAVAEGDADDILLRLKGLKEKAFIIGEILDYSGEENRVQFLG
jgi:phosphoribosylformylglycinamidine cyclo-ligase